MGYTCLALLIGVLIIIYIFTKYMMIKYNITRKEFQNIKLKYIKRSTYFIIVSVIALFTIIMKGYNIYTTIMAVLLVIGDFIYGLIEIKKLNEYKYNLYYIVYEFLTFLCFLLTMAMILIA